MPKPIDRFEVQRLLKAGAQLVEVLPPEEYKEEHIPGATSLPLRRIESQAHDLLDPTRPVIVYCFDSG